MTTSTSPLVFPLIGNPFVIFPGQAINLFAPADPNRLDFPGRRAAALAREVRNPLTCINLSVEMLKTAVTDKELKVYTDIIARSSNRINRLIKELLECQEVGALSHTNY
jgi:signal transduction histidine kinase